MVRRFLVSAAILSLVLAMVPACSDSKSNSGATPTIKDEPPPEPRPAGKAG